MFFFKISIYTIYQGKLSLWLFSNTGILKTAPKLLCRKKTSTISWQKGAGRHQGNSHSKTNWQCHGKPKKNPQYRKLKTVQHELPQPRRRIMSSGNVSISCCTCDARCVTTIIYVKWLKQMLRQPVIVDW